ncbi:unnamed protein product [Cylindrotheca closterium]|uniref:Twin-arginine translocation signal domain-containing protein n=1 Tax=Cylindrotheca closterium TaxID=2856 RepID=A0AAD2PXA7_9STRA|nr:unnamed protein product [Cylindrotheca closterium]
MLKYIVGFLLCSTLQVTGFSTPGRNNGSRTKKHETSIGAVTTNDNSQSDEFQRRQFLKTSAFAAIGMLGASSAFPQEAQAQYVLDDETGEYVQVEDGDWQEAWRQRLDKAKGMSQQEIFQAARGAGNLNLKDGPESDASKKRRAMSGCRDAAVRDKAKAGNERECTSRVFGGEVDFILEAL